MSDVMEQPDEWCREYGFVLKTGRGVKEDRFSLDREGNMAQGHDSPVFLQTDMSVSHCPGGFESLTPAEWVEIADEMLTRWLAFRMRMETQAAFLASIDVGPTPSLPAQS